MGRLVHDQGAGSPIERATSLRRHLPTARRAPRAPVAAIRQRASLDGGPLSYRSSQAPEPLTLDEEAALAFAAAGLRGAHSRICRTNGAESESGGGNIIIHFVGRTVPSGDAMNSVVLFVLNDEGTWLLRRPQDFHGEALAAQITAGRDGRLRRPTRPPAYGCRPGVPRSSIASRSCRRSTSGIRTLQGSTYFVTVTDFTALYINVLLAAFSEELGYFIVDDHAGYRPAGLKRFGRSQGGHLYDDPDEGGS